MKLRLVVIVAMFAALAAPVAAQRPDFSGNWKLDRSASTLNAPLGLAGLGHPAPPDPSGAPRSPSPPPQGIPARRSRWAPEAGQSPAGDCRERGGLPRARTLKPIGHSGPTRCRLRHRAGWPRGLETDGSTLWVTAVPAGLGSHSPPAWTLPCGTCSRPCASQRTWLLWAA